MICRFSRKERDLCQFCGRSGRRGKRWKRIHQTIYFIVPLLLLHYAWGKKGDFFALQGEIIRPLIYTVIAVILLVMRIPPIRRFLASLPSRILLLARKRGTQPETTA